MSKKIRRRKFIKNSLLIAGYSLIAHQQLKLFSKTLNISSMDELNEKTEKEAMHYQIMPNAVRCQLCPNQCILKPGNKSICKTRININNKLYTLAYGNPCVVHIDPVEKKPLFHFKPGTKTYSIATAGCNLSCLNCQNWDISQVSPTETRNRDLAPDKVLAETINNNCGSISYTYSEPIAFYEYTYETAKLAKTKGLKNIMITAGYINEKPMKELAPYLDAANVNLKSFNDDIYMRLNGGRLEPILNTLKILKEMNVWLEITNLIVPTWTDDFEMIKKMCEWLVKNGFANYPLHFNRFYPMYKLSQLPETPVSHLEKARDIAIATGIKFVYLGNVPGHKSENTYCPKCKKIIIQRRGHTIINNYIKNSACSFCSEKIPGKW